MNWLLHLYPERWRERYGEEFGAVLANQRASVGLVLDVLGGAIDAHLHPQIQNLHREPSKGEDMMTLEMLQRCTVGGPKLSLQDRRIASRYTILSALGIAVLYLALTKIYRGAPVAQAVFYASIPFLALVRGQTAYSRKRSWQTQLVVLGGGLLGMYLFMLGVCVVASKL